MSTPITWEEIDAARTPKGGFTRKALEQWGIPWPPPSGWRDCLAAHGYPYQHDLNTFGKSKDEMVISEPALERMMEASKPDLIDGDTFECVGDLDIDPAKLLRKVVTAVINHGQSHILWEFPEVLAFFGSRIPQREEVAHLHNVDERMFEAADKWPNRKPRQPQEASA